MNECIFCAIAAGEVATTLIHADDDVVAFRDLNPQAPTHVLVIPRRHIASLAALTADDHHLWGIMLAVTQDIAVDEGIAESGYRVVTNIGTDGGQSVGHLHLHLLGGRALAWPPG